MVEEEPKNISRVKDHGMPPASPPVRPVALHSATIVPDDVV